MTRLAPEGAYHYQKRLRRRFPLPSRHAFVSSQNVRDGRRARSVSAPVLALRLRPHSGQRSQNRRLRDCCQLLPPRAPIPSFCSRRRSRLVLWARPKTAVEKPRAARLKSVQQFGSLAYIIESNHSPLHLSAWPPRPARALNRRDSESRQLSPARRKPPPRPAVLRSKHPNGGSDRLLLKRHRTCDLLIC
jgi:hypothetical protein